MPVWAPSSGSRAGRCRIGKPRGARQTGVSREPAGYASCHAHVVTDANLHPLATSTYQGGYSPAQLRAAYGLSTDSRAKVAIVDAYANPNAVGDLAAYRTKFTLVAANLTQVNQSGGLISTVSGNTGWGQEEMLDLEMISAICPSCQLIYVGANSASFNDLAAAVDRAALLGATASPTHTAVRAIHLSRLHWCDAVPRLAGWCPVPAFARRVPVMVRHGRGLLGLSGVAALAGRVRLPTM